MNPSADDRLFIRRTTLAAIQLAVLAAWVALSAHFIAPFFFLVIWAAVLATAVAPLLRRTMPEHPKTGAIVFALVALALILVPSWLVFEAVANSIVDTGRRLAQGEVKLPPPNQRLLEWPILGKRLYDGWMRAVETPAATIEHFVPQLRAGGRWLMQSAGHVMSGILQSALAVILAAFFLANARACQRGLTLVAERLLPGRGTQLIELSGATVRSVAQGVIGIALLQALAAALGLFLVGVPAAGLWSGLVLMLAVMQLPPLLVLGPVAAYVFTSSNTSTAVAFLIWSLIVSASDGFLKPLFLGRGVGVPTLVILIGAIGGMITNGIIGLFVGAVVLAVGYQLSAAWVSDDDDTPGLAPARAMALNTTTPADAAPAPAPRPES